MACNCLSRAWRLRISSQRLTACAFLARPIGRNYVTTNFAKPSWMELSANNGIKFMNRSIWKRNFKAIESVGKSRFLIQLKGLHGKANSSHARAKFNMSERHKSVAMYTVSVVILVCGGSYAAVPLYRLYCQASGYGGTVKVIEVGENIQNMEKQTHRLLTVKFNADKSATMQWDFKPQQTQIKIVPGETALAFYTAKNPTDVPITGVSTYNVLPFEAGQYFNKIQCFCFEEQRLNPGEEVDMPVFFYIDPEFVLDPSLRKVTEITLSYTFFEAKDGSWPDLGVQPSYAIGGHGTT